MSLTLVFSILFGYYAMLIVVSILTSRNATNETFFTANRKSPWYLVAFGMIGSSISGITFVSVPGEVGNSNWAYLQFLLGNFVGYWIIAMVLIPLYYKMNLISIYSYLHHRLGVKSYKTGSFFFIISQVIGSSFRLFVVTGVLQLAFFNAIGIPFWLTAFITILLIWVYTFKGGIKTVIWTDSLQTIFILLSIAITIFIIGHHLNLNFKSLLTTIQQDPHSQIFDWNWKSKTNFFKQFIAGLGIVIVMNGLNQNMMQKSLTCKNPNEAKKNLYYFSFYFIITNLLFLSLGVLLYFYARKTGIMLPAKSDDLFPTLAINNFGVLAGIVFLLGITATAYSSADSALTALTTAFCIDILNFSSSSSDRKNTRLGVHIGFSILMFLVIVLFRMIKNESIITLVFKVAGYTYGPLLGLFAFGLLTHRTLRDRYVPYVCILSPILTYIINNNSEAWLWGYKFGFELLILNGLLTFIGLWILSIKQPILTHKD
ncbi:MAG: sodium:solute symporter [Bacteroidota bacterium]|nr:sodium:solute symporter [Bacteroidota bacterium]